METAVAAGAQVSNPVARFATDDNGVIVGAIQPTAANGNNAAGAFYSINGATPVTINAIAATGHMTAQAINNSSNIGISSEE